MPNVTTELEFGSEFQLLVAVILSAQCTDKRVNQVTPELFRHYPTAEAMAKAEAEDIFVFVKSVSYPNAKAAHLAEMARQPVERFAGGFRTSCNAGRYSCIQGEPPNRARVYFRQHSKESGRTTEEIYSSRGTGIGTPLDSFAWAICLHGKKAALREVQDCGSVS